MGRRRSVLRDSAAQLLLGLLVAVLLAGVSAQTRFTYEPPGQLVPGSGQGLADNVVHLPGMRFPLEAAPAFANSQVWGFGGSHGAGGDGQCDMRNYSYPWRDNFCETRIGSGPILLCPSGSGHQGQDIRPATCRRGEHWAVAVEAGTIVHIGSYAVYLRGDGTALRYRYLHLDHERLKVTVGQSVAPGQRIGLVSDNAPYTTSIHLHFDVFSDGVGSYLPPYMSLVRSYQRHLAGRGQRPSR